MIRNLITIISSVIDLVFTLLIGEAKQFSHHQLLWCARDSARQSVLCFHANCDIFKTVLIGVKNQKVFFVSFFVCFFYCLIIWPRKCQKIQENQAIWDGGPPFQSPHSKAESECAIIESDKQLIVRKWLNILCAILSFLRNCFYF